MYNFYKPPTRRCTEIGANVQVTQSELSCREQHGCDQYSCPLAAEFMPEPIDFMAAAARLQSQSS